MKSSEVPEDTMSRSSDMEDSHMEHKGASSTKASSISSPSSQAKNPEDPLPAEPHKRESRGPEYFSLMEDDDDDYLCMEPKPRSWRTALNYGCGLIFALFLLGSAFLVGSKFGSQQVLMEPTADTSTTTADATPTGQCIVDVSVGKGGDELELQRLSGEKVSVSLRPDEPEAVSTQPVPHDAQPEEAPSAAQANAALTQNEDEYPDLTCSSSAHFEWQEFKALTGKWFGSWSSGVVPKGQAQLQNLVDLAVRKLHAMTDRVEECAMGRLFVSLLAIAAGEGTLKSNKHIHDPLLAILLEYPWSIVMRSGWPVFALLAQLQLQQKRADDFPSSGPDGDYFEGLHEKLRNQKPQELAALGADFVRTQQHENPNNQRFLVFPALCALASQLFGQSPQVVGDALADEALRHMQGFFKQAVTNIDDLQSTLETSWPLYGLLNAAASQLSA